MFISISISKSQCKIGCALIGSLGALYNGVLLIDLAISLFALVAIESSSQSLARTYAMLLFCAILLDVSWFILFTYEIWCVHLYPLSLLICISCILFLYFAPKSSSGPYTLYAIHIRYVNSFSCLEHSDFMM